MEFLNPAPVDMWQQVAEQCPWASYFHTPGWAGAVVKAFPEFKISTLGCITDSGTRAVIPSVCRLRKGLLRQKKDFKSMEPGVYGGVIADGDLTPRESTRIVQQLMKAKNSSVRMVMSPFSGISPELPAATAKQMHTHVVTLGPDFEEVRRMFNRGQKSNINQARKKNVTVRPASAPEEIEQYDRMYRQSLERWSETAGRAYPREFFLDLFHPGDPHVTFWLARVDDAPAAGALVLSWNRTMIYWHGCALQEYFKHYPNNLLHAAIIQWGCEQGYEHYDMGASMQLEGVLKFKESFGARAVPFMSYRWK